MNPLQVAVEKIRLWRERPDIFVREVFQATPDPWQDEVLKMFPTSPRIAMKACAGPGKTALLAWLAWNFLLTRPHPRVAATAISGDNLKDNLWAEMAKWHQKSPMLLDQFSWHKERIECKEFPNTWWMSARQWSRSATPEQQGNTLRGLHEDYVMALLDESGGIPQSVMATVENIGSSAKEWHIVQAGNPTHLEGPLYAACTAARHLWKVIEITADPDDPMRTSRVSAQWAREQIQLYGKDHPWVLVNVLGKFPPASFDALIGPEDVEAAMKRHLHLHQYQFSAKVLGLDVARFGDDRTVIFPRQGLAAMNPVIMRNVEEEHGVGVLVQTYTQWQADAIFMDATGGWASGWRVLLKQLHYTPFEVQFAGKPNDPKYYNKRAEIWFDVCQWVKDGGALPPIPELVAEFTTPKYTFKGDKILIEEKAQVKLRLGRSPDLVDSLATTFASPVVSKRSVYTGVDTTSKVETEYDHLERA